MATERQRSNGMAERADPLLHSHQDNPLRELERFREMVVEVSVRRDLMTATEYGARINGLMARFDRRASDLSLQEQALLDLARGHVRAMINCPRRMRLDDEWQDDFVAEAVKAADALIRLANTREQARESTGDRA